MQPSSAHAPSPWPPVAYPLERTRMGLWALLAVASTAVMAVAGIVLLVSAITALVPVLGSGGGVAEGLGEMLASGGFSTAAGLLITVAAINAMVTFDVLALVSARRITATPGDPRRGMAVTVLTLTLIGGGSAVLFLAAWPAAVVLSPALGGIRLMIPMLVSQLTVPLALMARLALGVIGIIVMSTQHSAMQAARRAAPPPSPSRPL